MVEQGLQFRDPSAGMEVDFYWQPAAQSSLRECFSRKPPAHEWLSHARPKHDSNRSSVFASEKLSTKDCSCLVTWSAYLTSTQRYSDFLSRTYFTAVDRGIPVDKPGTFNCHNLTGLFKAFTPPHIATGIPNSSTIALKTLTHGDKRHKNDSVEHNRGPRILSLWTSLKVDQVVDYIFCIRLRFIHYVPSVKGPTLEPGTRSSTKSMVALPPKIPAHGHTIKAQEFIARHSHAPSTSSKDVKCRFLFVRVLTVSMRLLSNIGPNRLGGRARIIKVRVVKILFQEYEETVRQISSKCELLQYIHVAHLECITHRRYCKFNLDWTYRHSNMPKHCLWLI